MLDNMECLKRYVYHIIKIMNYIVNVSEGCKKIFDEIVPEYTYKSKVVTNTLDLLNIEKKKSPRDLHILVWKK